MANEHDANWHVAAGAKDVSQLSRDELRPSCVELCCMIPSFNRVICSWIGHFMFGIKCSFMGEWMFGIACNWSLETYFLKPWCERRLR
jgi:hypothetical protein